MEALVIGGGPAGLMAADVLSSAGKRVVIAEAKPSLGRKLLMAGKSGLNLSKSEPLAEFITAYGSGADWLSPALAEFGPTEVMGWARSLRQDVFTGTSGRIFPTAMKASPLLRAWLARLNAAGVEIRTRWRWQDWQNGFVFSTPDGLRTMRPSVAVLALGGGSWARLGSDGAWVALLTEMGVPVTPLSASNTAYAVAWSPEMERHFGAAIKACRLTAGPLTSRAEFVLTTRGVEGGGIYTLGPALREGAALMVDLMPERTIEDIARRLSRPRNGATISNHLRKTLNLSAAKIALLRECTAEGLSDPGATARALKALTLPVLGPGPMDQAISTAGGVPREAVDAHFMLGKHPGIFCAGEMLDWDAPTGGYLLTACLATGRRAGVGALDWLKRTDFLSG